MLSIKDFAYEQNNDCLYVIFDNDNHVYRYDNMSRRKDAYGRIYLNLSSADLKIATFHTEVITKKTNSLTRIYLDYISRTNWCIRVYGHVGDEYDEEEWNGSP